MPGPVFQGRCIREIVVPQQSVIKNDCERCGGTWFTEQQAPTAKVIIRFVDPAGEGIHKSYDVLCKGCEQTVKNLVTSLVKDLKKSSPSKPRAKREAKGTPPMETTMTPGDAVEKKPGVDTVNLTRAHGVPARRQ